MTDKEIRQFSDNIDVLLGKRRLADAYEAIRNAARSVSDWKIVDRVDHAEQSYRYMLRYLVDGVADPQRDKVYTDLVNEAALIRDMLVRSISLADMPTLYFNTLRSVGAHGDETLRGLYDDYLRACDSMSPFNTISHDISVSESDRLRAEMIERDIFNRIWVTFPFSVDDETIVNDMLADDALPVAARSLFVSAVTLGLLAYCDDRRLTVLTEAYRSPHTQISVRALVGLTIALDKYKSHEFAAPLVNRIAALRELPGWHEDIRQTVVELIRTNDTERISGKLRDEIFPEIKKMSRDIADRFAGSLSDLDNMSDDANPEWENLISDERIRNNLKELGELQQEGADVFMATFAGLKQFPFFNETANWFMPYRSDHSVVASAGFGPTLSIGTLIDSAPYICDSDKYSMLLSLSMMPQSQRSMMASQIESQKQEINEAMAMADRSLHPVERKSEINNYVLSIYRFYKLFRRKGEFYNPFGHVVNPVDITLLRDDFAGEESLVSLGEFYFKVGLYAYSCHIFNRLDEMLGPDAARYQKIGFCYEKLGDFEKAASYYEQADLLDGGNVWNLRRLAFVCRKLRRYSQAISVTSRLERIVPDDVSTAMNLGYLYILTGDYEKAIEQFHRVEFIDETSDRPVRPLAWALFLSRRYDEAQTYYSRILAGSPNANDYLNMGHLAWAQGRLHNAIDFYRLSAAESSADALVASIRDDSPNLEIAGIDTSSMPMMLDALRYELGG